MSIQAFYEDLAETTSPQFNRSELRLLADMKKSEKQATAFTAGHMRKGRSLHAKTYPTNMRAAAAAESLRKKGIVTLKIQDAGGGEKGHGSTYILKANPKHPYWRR
jgi:hypothetical protein